MLSASKSHCVQCVLLIGAKIKNSKSRLFNVASSSTFREYKKLILPVSLLFKYPWTHNSAQRMSNSIWPHCAFRLVVGSQMLYNNLVRLRVSSSALYQDRTTGRVWDRPMEPHDQCLRTYGLVLHMAHSCRPFYNMLGILELLDKPLATHFTALTLIPDDCCRWLHWLQDTPINAGALKLP